MQCKNLPGKNVHVIRLNRRVSVIRHRLVLATARALPISRHKRTTYFCRPMFNTVVGYTHTSLFSVFEYPESEENKVSVSGLRSRPARVSTQRAVLWDCQSRCRSCSVLGNVNIVSDVATPRSAPWPNYPGKKLDPSMHKTTRFVFRHFGPNRSNVY